MAQHERGTAYYHLPGLFEFYELYRVFLPLFREHREYFYDWCEIGSVYGAPADCIWGGGRTGFGDAQPHRVLALMQEYGISARLTFSNSLLREEHLADRKCNALCALFEKENRVQNGVIVHSDLLLDYLKRQYPGLYFVSSTTKVLTDFQQLRRETEREEFRYVVPDFRLNKSFATNAAGTAAGTESTATRMSAAKIWARTARTTAAQRRAHSRAIVFQRQWKTPASSGPGISAKFICPAAFPTSKSRGGDWAAR